MWLVGNRSLWFFDTSSVGTMVRIALVAALGFLALFDRRRADRSRRPARVRRRRDG